MNDDQELDDQPSKGFSLDSVYYVIFRQKWIILFFLAAAIFGALTLLFVIKPPQYHSEALLFIRYVVERRTPTASGIEPAARELNEADESIINTEIDILRSVDVAQAVVTAVGAERILAKVGGGRDFNTATTLVQNNLMVEPLARRSVLPILFRHPDPELAQEVLRKIIVAYSDKHIKMHQPLQMYGQFFDEETARLREELAKTEQQLKAAKIEAGVASIEEGRKAYTDQISTIREELFKAHADLAAYEAIAGEGGTLALSTNQVETNIVAQVPLDRRSEYSEICKRLEQLTSVKETLRITYTEENLMVKAYQARIDETKNQKMKLEKEYPGLVHMAASPGQLAGQPLMATVDPSTAAIQVRSLESKIKYLDSQLAEVQGEAAKADAMESQILELQRKREVLETDIKRFSATVQQSRIDAALGSGGAPNISVIQSPTVPRKMWSKNFLKKLGVLTAGCALFGFALAFLIEMVLDRSVRRPGDVETKLGLPLLISIPDINRNGHRQSSRTRKSRSRLRDTNENHGQTTSKASGNMAVARWDGGDALRCYCEGLRDRLIVDFEVRNVGHKPKLVAVTSCGGGAGVSSIATGLAAALSETGNGNVLLVDGNDDQGRPQAFHKGKAAHELDDTGPEESMPSAHSHENACSDADQGDDSKLPSVLPKRFANLMPRLQASDYDYIIFDMPPVSQTSITPRLAGVMDSVLLVVESEKTNQETVQQANAMLAKSKAKVSTVLNKVRTYIPTRLYQDFLNDA